MVGSDILYDERSAHALLALLGRVLAPDGEVWLADPGREPAQRFLKAATGAWRQTKRPCGYGVTVYRLARAGREY